MAQHADAEETDDNHRSVRRKQRNSRLSSSSMNSLQSKPAQTLLPISITIRNLFPPLVVFAHYNNADHEGDDSVTKDDGTTGDDNLDDESINEREIKPSLSSKISSLMVEDRCTLVAADVLLRIRLDILIQSESSSSIPETILYSSEKLNCTAHPRWDHLDEQLLLSDDTVQDDDLLTANLYARFVAIRNDDNEQPAAATDENDEIVLAQVSLHPSNLRRLPAKDDDRNNNSSSSSGKNMTIPDSLPPNAILFHYADGYTRVVPNLYGLLVQKGITTENIVVDPLKKSENEDNDGNSNDNFKDDINKSVFEDDAFDALGTTSEGADVDNRKKNTMHSSDDNDDKMFSLLDAPASREGHDVNNDEEPDTNGVDDATMDTSILTEETDSHDAIDLGRNEQSLSPIQAHLPPIMDPLPQLFSLEAADTENRTTAYIDSEIEELKRLVHHERQLLEQERNEIKEETNHLTLIMEQMQQLDQESTQVMKTVGVESTDLYRAECRLEAHRIRLLKQLQSILPIRVMSVNISVNPPQYPQHQYTVAGIPLPDDIHSVSVSDDQISTSIGFLCYLVSLTSKYLAISPRYKMVCRFSRSAIIDDQAGLLSIHNKPSTVYPLFRERGAVDKEQLDHGFALLVRNIECLLQMRNVEFHYGWNALAKMEKLFMHVVDGSID
eukprot:scaffold3660_cov129-Skeletonema_dohrnii-CCMP3373.AAC.13